MPPQLITNWFIYNHQVNLPPFCMLDTESVKHILGGADKLQNMERFMLFIEQVGGKNDYWEYCLFRINVLIFMQENFLARFSFARAI